MYIVSCVQGLVLRKEKPEADTEIENEELSVALKQEQGEFKKEERVWVNK